MPNAKTTQRVADLTVTQLEALIKRAVKKALAEHNGKAEDPDAGRRLKPEVAARLEKSIREMKAGKPGIPAEKVFKDLGVKW